VSYGDCLPASDLLCRNSTDYVTALDIAEHNSTGGDNCMIAYMNSWQNHRVRANPDVASYRYVSITYGLVDHAKLRRCAVLVALAVDRNARRDCATFADLETALRIEHTELIEVGQGSNHQGSILARRVHVRVSVKRHLLADCHVSRANELHVPANAQPTATETDRVEPTSDSSFDA
jgi:hypothetical protein